MLETATAAPSYTADPALAPSPGLTPFSAPSAASDGIAAAASAGQAAPGAPLPAAAASVAASVTRGLPAQAPAGQVFARIEQSVTAGQTRFAVRLHPEELGRVEVVLDFQDGRVQAVITADRQSTLDMLQRDARWLERAMEQGGFKLQQDGLQFTLRDGQSGAGHDGGQRAARLMAAGLEPAGTPDEILAPAAVRRLEGLVDFQV